MGSLGIWVGSREECSFTLSMVRNILAASKARRLPRISIGCLTSPTLQEYCLYIQTYKQMPWYLTAVRIVLFIILSVRFFFLSSSTVCLNHCITSSLGLNTLLSHILGHTLTGLSPPYQSHYVGKVNLPSSSSSLG